VEPSRQRWVILCYYWSGTGPVRILGGWVHRKPTPDNPEASDVYVLLERTNFKSTTAIPNTPKNGTAKSGQEYAVFTLGKTGNELIDVRDDQSHPDQPAVVVTLCRTSETG